MRDIWLAWEDNNPKAWWSPTPYPEGGESVRAIIPTDAECKQCLRLADKLKDGSFSDLERLRAAEILEEVGGVSDG